MNKKIRLAVYEKYDGHCSYCGEKIEYSKMQVDHMFPKYRGGTDDISILVPSCRSCNATKSTYTIEEFRKRIADDVARLYRDSAKFRILERFGQVAITERPVVFYFERPEKLT